MSNEKNCIDCGCTDNTAPVMPPMGSGGDCPNPEPCSTITPAQCVVFTGNDKLCGEDTVYESGDRLPTILSNIVDYFCEANSNPNVTIPTTVECNRQEIYLEGDSIQEALSKTVDYFCARGYQLREILQEDLASAISGGGLDPGLLYHITDRDIYLQALNNNSISFTGNRVMRIVKPEYYVPATGILGVWYAGLTPSAGDKVVWGGRVWENVSGNVGASVDDLTLDSEWTLISVSNNTYYEQKIFGCTYDLDNDWVASQWDDRGNVFTLSYLLNQDNYGYPTEPVSFSDWGNERITDNVCIGVWNNRIDNNIFNNTINEFISKNICVSITFNNCRGIISENTNNGEISFNTCVSISQNQNNGNIIFNTNNGSILGIGSANDNIQYNTNNGNITTTTTGDISDPIVNK